MDADLSKNATGRELNEDIKNGFYDKMSFAFTVAKESYDKKSRTRTIEAIDRLFDVSAVTFPAYNQTTISARSFFEVEAEKERAEARESLELAKTKYFYEVITCQSKK
jgi:phage head maturation protease